MSPRLFVAASILLGFLLALPASVRSDDAAVKQALGKMLDEGWQNTKKARTAADAAYQELKRRAPTDSRVPYAYALIHVKHRSYPEAIKLLDEVLLSDKTDRQVWKSKSWLSVITKNYGSALVELDRLSQLLPADQSVAEAEEPNLELARYLGRVFGFLEGPVADALNPAQREEAKKRILARLSEPRQTAFEEGRTRVLAAFNSLGVEKEESDEKAKVAAEDEREKLLDDLEGRKEQLAARRAAIAPMREELRSQIKGENDRFAKEERPLVSELNIIGTQAAGARRELDLISVDILRIRALLDKEKDPLLRDRLLRDLDRAQIIAARIDANVVAFDRRAAGVNAQLVTLQRTHLAEQSRLAVRLARLDADAVALDKQEKRNELDTTKARKPAVGDVRRSRSLSAQATAFSTYEEFPLEAEKQRLLESYK